MKHTEFWNLIDNIINKKVTFSTWCLFWRDNIDSTKLQYIPMLLAKQHKKFQTLKLLTLHFYFQFF